VKQFLNEIISQKLLKNIALFHFHVRAVCISMSTSYFTI
jgi:hypothetical protein